MNVICQLPGDRQSSHVLRGEVEIAFTVRFRGTERSDAILGAIHYGYVWDWSTGRVKDNSFDSLSKLGLWFAKTPAEAQNGAVLDGVSLNTIIDSIPQEDSGGHEPQCVEDTYI